MKNNILHIKSAYRENPGWCWLIGIIFLFPILPEYISPFLLFGGFIVFKRQWSKEGKKARVGTMGKMMMTFMGFAMLSTLWSDTKFSTFATAWLWWGIFLVQVMINNLATSRKKIDQILKAIALSGAVTGLIGAVQVCTYALNKHCGLNSKFILVTPLYKTLDKLVYTSLPFAINTNTFASRASSTFSNPNLLATYMLVSFPISIYLFINAKTHKSRILYFFANILISAGMSSTMSRAGCVVVLAGWLIMFIALFKKNWKDLLKVFIPTVAIIIPSLLTRYGIILTSSGKEAKKSSANHFDIWLSTIDHITSNWDVFLFGNGFGCEQTGVVLSTMYDLDKPHAHNFILETWMELGIIGIILLFLVIIWTCGKLLEINANNDKKFTLVFSLFTSFLLLLVFGLSDYVFNSPKQIVYFFICIGLTQAISNCYEKTEITGVRTFERAAKKQIANSLK